MTDKITQSLLFCRDSLDNGEGTAAYSKAVVCISGCSSCGFARVQGGSTSRLDRTVSRLRDIWRNIHSRSALSSFHSANAVSDRGSSLKSLPFRHNSMTAGRHGPWPLCKLRSISTASFSERESRPAWPITVCRGYVACASGSSI